MRLHTNGATTVLLTPEAKITWRPSGRTTVEEVAKAPVAEVTDYDRSGLLCVTPSCERDFSARLAAAGAVDADATDEENVAAVIVGEDGVFLVRGPFSTEGDWPLVIDLSEVEPSRPSWPAGLIWKKGDKAMYDMAKSYGPGIPGSFVPAVESNQHGTAVASCGSGTIVLVRPGSKTIDLAIQLPSQEEAVLFATPMEKGLLVTIIVDGQDSAYLRIDDSGKIIAHREASCACPAVVLDKSILIYDETQSSLLLVNDKLETVSSLEIDFSPFEAARAPDGSAFAVADAEHVLRGLVNVKNQIQVVENIDLKSGMTTKSAGEKAAEEAGFDPERAHGKAAVGFAADVPQAPWRARADEDFELVVVARSTGGPGRGIALELGGDCMAHCELVEASAGGESMALTRIGSTYKATFPQVALPRGVKMPLQPKPKNDAQKHAAALLLQETHIEVTIRGKALTASDKLLSVAISAVDSDSPPLKWMRPLTIQ